MTGGPFGLLTALATGGGLLVAMGQVVAQASLGAQILVGVVGGLSIVSFVAQFFGEGQ